MEKKKKCVWGVRCEVRLLDFMHTDIKGTVFKQSLGLQREDQTRNSYTDVLSTFCKPPPPPHGLLQPPIWRNAERIITLIL